MSAGWIPNQHGAWAMLILPFLLGITLRTVDTGEFALGRTLALFVVWFIGYFCFHVTSLWLKSRRKPRYLQPMITYAVIAALGGVGVLLTAPRLADWIIAFIPLLTIGLVAAARRNERSLSSGLATTAAASLMLPVAYGNSMLELFSLLVDEIATGNRGATVFAALATVAVFAYFAGTIFVVKTMIRKRGQSEWVWASVGYHAAWTAVFAALALAGWTSWLFAIFFAATTVRAWVLPAIGKSRKVTPLQLGIVEIVFTVVLAIVVFVARV